MELNAKSYGSPDNPPLVVLHGLFGDLGNWAGQCQALAEDYWVWALDLRNHGRSGWSDQHHYPAMADDLLEFLDQQQIERCLLLGHSMGGKVAMQFALDYPQRLDKLIVVDIAPVEYPPGHNEVFNGLNAVSLDTLSSRNEADQQLQPHIDEAGVRLFLLKNLYRDGQRFAWRMNLRTLEQQYSEIAKAPQPRFEHQVFDKPTLFIKGELSDYIQEGHRPAIGQLFANAQARILSGAGHWPHAEKPQPFNALVKRFLGKG